MSASLTSPPKALLYLPEGVRLQLARLTLWNRRQPRLLKPIMLATVLTILCSALGFSLTQRSPLRIAYGYSPQLAAAQPSALPDDAISGAFPTPSQWGELQAELLRLRLLFGRIVEAADLDGGEFALVESLADKRFLDSLSVLENDTGAMQKRFVLAKSAVDHMTEQARTMLSISTFREQQRRFTLSGSPVIRARLTSRYGYRSDPESGRRLFHRGLDFGGSKGSKVLALAAGVVTYSGRNGAYGNLVELEHAGGYRTRYAHNEMNLVRVGGKVSKGQVIATMGSTGKSTGSHVHLEVRLRGRALDPMQFISAGS